MRSELGQRDRMVEQPESLTGRALKQPTWLIEQAVKLPVKQVGKALKQPKGLIEKAIKPPVMQVETEH